MKRQLDVYNPVNWNCPLNSRLIGLWLAGYGVTGFNSNILYDLCRKNNGRLTNGQTWARNYGLLGHSGSVVNNQTIDAGIIIDPQLGVGSFSYFFWFLCDIFNTDDRRGVCTDNNGTGNTGSALHFNATPTLNFRVDAGPSAATTATGATTLAIETWYFGGGVYDKTSQIQYVYLNGKRDGSAIPHVNGNGSCNNLRLFGPTTGAIGSLDGRIAAGFLYRRAISEDEVAALYLEGLSGYPQMLNYVRSTKYFLPQVADTPITSYLSMKSINKFLSIKVN